MVLRLRVVVRLSRSHLLLPWTGAMTDACKRRKNEPEELSSDSEWDATVGRSSDSLAIDNQARYVTEGDTVVAKPMKKSDVSVAVKNPDTSHVRHVDKSIAVPPGVADFKVWSQTVIVMDKYADLNWSFSELLAAGEGDAKDCTLHLMDCWHLRPHLPSKTRRTRRKILACMPELAAGSPSRRDINERPSESLRDVCGDLYE